MRRSHHGDDDAFRSVEVQGDGVADTTSFRLLRVRILLGVEESS